jgi:hypothetical protein
LKKVRQSAAGVSLLEARYYLLPLLLVRPDEPELRLEPEDEDEPELPLDEEELLPEE